jgi:hypothetical protein
MTYEHVGKQVEWALYFGHFIKSRKIRLERHVARMGKITDTYNILVGEPEVKIPGCRREDNIIMDLRKI